jgi:hypothetical protein
MEVAETLIAEVARDFDDPLADEAALVSWFAARQPGVVRFLASRLGDHGDAMSLGVTYACLIHRAYERMVGLSPERASFALIERAERAFLDEALDAMKVMDGLAARQPALAQLVAGVIDAPPVPLGDDECVSVGVALAAVVYALDETTNGRSVP